MVSEAGTMMMTMTTDNERHPDFVPWRLLLPIWGMGVLSGVIMTLLTLLLALAARVLVVL